MTIPQAFLTDLRNRLSLAEHVGRHTPLAEIGGGEFPILAGRCPYCDAEGCRIVVFERCRTMTPRYKCIPAEIIDRVVQRAPLESGLIYSPSCGAGGCVIGLTMRMRNIGFRAAVRALCDEADLPMPVEVPNAPSGAAHPPVPWRLIGYSVDERGAPIRRAANTSSTT